ncbi:MAG: hemerythrin domain-containing protein [Acidobacteriota bacterium]|nr:hemerythrin domain-containing protein [Acidobacteriota bacterium]
MERLVDNPDIAVVCDAIVARYHAGLQEALPRIRDAMASVSATAASPELALLRVAFDELAEQIEYHLAKEEHLLFPAFAALSAADRTGGDRPATAFVTVLHPIRAMEAEHVRIEQALDRLRELARAVVEPDALAANWRQCLAELATLDADLRADHRTENEVLFPRALELERRLL